MDRKKFLRTLGLLPLFNVVLDGLAKSRDLIAHGRCRTQGDQEGPFYKSNSPGRSLIETNGTPLYIEGKVLKGDDCETPVKDAVLDIWHCDDHGKYDMSGFGCRGQVKTDSKGSYSFTTIFPPPYGGRPRHIHVKVRAPGFQELTTQIYFKGDPNLGNDFSRSAEAARTIELTSGKDMKKGMFNVYL
jgi:protocatechuate 3,4-dioxygenase beta subunit